MTQYKRIKLMKQLGQASIAAVRQYLRLAQTREWDITSLLQTAGLAETQLNADNGQINGEQFQRLIRALLDHSDDPLLGLHSGDFVQPGSYNVLGYITMSCATLGEVIARIAPYEKLVGDMGLTQVSLQAGELHIRWSCAYPDPRVRPHMIDNVFASWINYARWLGDDVAASPLRVELEREHPGGELAEAYQARWLCPVHFGCPHSLIVIDPALLNQRLRQPDPLLRKTLESHAQNRIAALDEDQALVIRVRQAIRGQLEQGITRQDMVAEQLDMTPRTLQRHLSQENLSYQQLLDNERHALACAQLSDTPLTIQDIALRLGFAEVRSFHRCFKRWTGMTPGEYREKH